MQMRLADPMEIQQICFAVHHCGSRALRTGCEGLQGTIGQHTLALSAEGRAPLSLGAVCLLIFLEPSPRGVYGPCQESIPWHAWLHLFPIRLLAEEQS